MTRTTSSHSFLLRKESYGVVPARFERWHGHIPTKHGVVPTPLSYTKWQGSAHVVGPSLPCGTAGPPPLSPFKAGEGDQNVA